MRRPGVRRAFVRLAIATSQPEMSAAASWLGLARPRGVTIAADEWRALSIA